MLDKAMIADATGRVWQVMERKRLMVTTSGVTFAAAVARARDAEIG